MKRTIKFRGYNKKNNKWIYGYYLVNRGQHFVVEDGIANPLNTWEDYLVEADTIGQFTGLLDKNGIEIYEGDIVLLLSIIEMAFVCYNNDRCWFEFRRYMAKGGFISTPKDFNTYLYEVVGNTYDNPELINGKEKAK